MIGYKRFLDKDVNIKLNRLKVTKVKKTNYGYIIHLFTNFICIYKKYVYVQKNGTAKIKTIVEKNYHAKYQNTTYENKEGQEISRKEYQLLNKN